MTISLNWAATRCWPTRSSPGCEPPFRRTYLCAACSEEPTVSGLAERIQSAMKSGQGLERPPIEPVPRDGAFPVSFAQQRVWILEQLEPGRSVYNNLFAVSLTGPLNAPALEQSLNEIVRRHELLRTTFATSDGQPVQVIGPAKAERLAALDLSGLPEAEREARLRLISSEEAGRPFDLTRGPLFRVRLVKLGEQNHAALFMMHHIVSDAWSLGIFVQELTKLYNSLLTGAPSPLPELTIQYADFSVWQRQWLQGETLDALLDYWKSQLGENIQELNLPTDHPRPLAPSYRSATQSFVLPAALTESLGRSATRRKPRPS